MGFKRNISSKLLTYFFITLAGFGTSIITNRCLGPESKGVFSFILLVCSVIYICTNMGIGSATVFFTAGGKYRKSQVAACSVFINLFLTFAGLGIFFIYMTVGGETSDSIWKDLPLVIPVILLQYFTPSFEEILTGENKIVESNRINFTNSLFTFAATVLLFSAASLNYKSAIVIAVLSNILVIALNITAAFDFTFSEFRAGVDFKLIKEMLRYGIKNHISNLAAYLNYRLDMVLVIFFLDYRALGLYSLSVSLAEKLWIIPSCSASVLFPAVAGGHENNITPRVCRLNLAVSIVFCIAVSLIAGQVVPAFYGRDFSGSVIGLLWLLPGAAVFNISKVLGADLAARNRQTRNIAASAAGLVCNLLLNLLLIPRFGIAGAAAASTVSYTVSSIYLLISFSRLTGNRIVDSLLINMGDVKMLIYTLQSVRKRITGIM